MDGLELIIDYYTALTPKQVAVFYDGLYKILDEIHIADSVDIVIEKGSLKTIIILGTAGAALLAQGFMSKMGEGIYDFVKTKFIQTYNNPQTSIEKSVLKSFVQEYKQPNFRSISINIKGDDNQVILDLDQIKKKAQYWQDNDNDEAVSSIEMYLETGKSIETVENKKGSINTSHKFKYTAKFSDPRYEGVKYKVPIESSDSRFYQLDLTQAHTYSFIADGILHKSDGKYIKFEILELKDLEQKQPQLI